jgi:multidrug resistance efflux pump
MPTLGERTQPTEFNPASIRRMQRRVVIAILAAVVLGLTTGLIADRFRYERFSGYLQAQARSVSSDRPVKLARILATENTWVEAGTPLFVLEDSELTRELRVQARSVERLRAELTRAQAAAEVEVAWKRKDLDKDIFETRIQLNEASKQRHIDTLAGDIYDQEARDTDERVIPATAGAFRVPVTRASIQNAAARYKQTQLRFKRDRARHEASSAAETIVLCQQRLEALERLASSLPDRIAESMGVPVVQSQLDAARDRLSNLEEQHRLLTVTAPCTGLVGVYQYSVGDFVDPHQPIVQLLDEDRPRLVVRIASDRLADFKPGTRLQLRFPGGVHGEGKVHEIPPQTTPIPGEGTSDVIADVVPAGRLWPRLPFGSAVQVLKPRS